MEATPGHVLEAVKPTFLSGKQQSLRMEMAVEEGVSRHPEMGRDSLRGETLTEQAREIQCYQYYL